MGWRSVVVLAAALVFVFGLAHAETPLERGRYIVEVIGACGNCHTPKGPNGPIAGKELAGGFEITDDAFTAVAPNITPDPETGIGTWTDAQLITAIREGKRPDGTTIGPPMPFEMYRGLSDNDVKAIVAYLRVVKPVVNKVAKSKYNFPLPPSYGPPVGSVPDVPRDDKLRYGAYLAGPVAHCLECHTPATADGKRLYETSTGAGGFAFKGPWGISVAANITPDPTTGIGGRTDAQLRRAITQGINSEGQRMNPPMPYDFYHNIRQEDLEAIIAFLRSLKPIK